MSTNGPTSAKNTTTASSNPTKRRRLGKGLSGLMGDPVPVEPPPTDATASTQAPEAASSNDASVEPDLTAATRTDSRTDTVTVHGASAHSKTESATSDDLSDVQSVIHLPVGSIIPNRFQPREQFDDDRLSELARSIARDGVMQPILVRPGSAGGSTGGRYELIAGERRWRAAKLAGLTRVPALVRPLEDRDAGAWALIENVHRQDLGPMEKADAIAGMIARDGLTQAEAAERLLLDRSTVANLVRLVGLEPAIRSLLNAGSLNTGHGKALAGLPAGATRVELAQAAAAGGWSVRRLERAAAESKAGKHPERGSANTPGTDDQSRHRLVLASMEKQLGESLNSRVRIRANKSGTKGAICIDFYGNDHFEGLVERLGVRPDV